MDKNKVYSTDLYKGKEKIFFDEQEAIIQLLEEQVLFSNYRTYSSDDKKLTNDGKTLVLYVNCSDVFSWGYADAEDISTEEELKSLYDYCEKYKSWGSTIWACIKRNQKPQSAVAKLLKEKNIWLDELEELPDNKYDKFLEEKYSKKQNTIDNSI